MIGVGNEDAPEESQREVAVEPLGAGILLGSGEADEGHPAQFQCADFHVLRWQGRKYQLPSVHTCSLDVTALRGRQVLSRVVENGAVRTGVEHEANGPRRIGQTHQDD